MKYLDGAALSEAVFGKRLERPSREECRVVSERFVPAAGRRILRVAARRDGKGRDAERRVGFARLER